MRSLPKGRWQDQGGACQLSQQRRWFTHRCLRCQRHVQTPSMTSGSRLHALQGVLCVFEVPAARVARGTLCVRSAGCTRCKGYLGCSKCRLHALQGALWVFEVPTARVANGTWGVRSADCTRCKRHLGCPARGLHVLHAGPATLFTGAPHLGVAPDPTHWQDRARSCRHASQRCVCLWRRQHHRQCVSQPRSRLDWQRRCWSCDGSAWKGPKDPSTTGPAPALVRVEGRIAPAGSGAAPRRDVCDAYFFVAGGFLAGAAGCFAPGAAGAGLAGPASLAWPPLYIWIARSVISRSARM